MATSPNRVILTNEDDDAKVDVETRGTKDALAVEILDASGNQVTSFGGSNASVSASGSAVPASGTYMGGINASGNLAGCLVDASGHLQVDVLSGGSGGTLVVDNEVVDGADTGQLVLGTDGSNYQIMAVDSSGHLQVDVLSGGGAGTQYAVDAALGATPTGTLCIAKRDDTLSSLTPVEADAVELRVDGVGALWVKHSGTVTVDGSGVTQPVSGTFYQATQPVSGTFWQATQPVSGTFYQATQPVSIAGTVTVDLAGNNDVGINAGTNLIGDATIRGNTVADGSGSDVWALIDAAGHLQIDVISAPSTAVTGTFWQATQPVSGTVTANLGATDNGVLDQIELNTDPLLVVGGGAEATAQRVTIANDSTGVVSIDDNAGAITIDWAGTAPPIGAGTEATALRVTLATDSTGVVSIDDNGGAITVDGSVTADLGVNNDVTVTSGSVDVLGDTAHDAADGGDPVKIGHKAVLFNSSAPPNTAAAENDRVNSIADEYGRQYVETTHPNYWDVSADYAGAQTNATVKAAAGAGLSLYITDIVISNGATAGNITLLDGSGGTVLFEIYPAVNGGASTNLRTPIKLTANTLLAITSTTVTTHAVTISGFIAP